VLKSKAAVASRNHVFKARAKSKPVLKIADTTIAGLADVFGLLADKSRLKILLALSEAGEMHVSALCGLLGQSQPAVSHHLTLLRMKDLVGYRRDGKHNFYRVDADRVRHLLDQFFADSGNVQNQLQFPGFSLAYKANGHNKKR
jgi:ArsR family transcriptional regulator